MNPNDLFDLHVGAYARGRCAELTQRAERLHSAARLCPGSPEASRNAALIDTLHDTCIGLFELNGLAVQAGHHDLAQQVEKQITTTAERLRHLAMDARLASVGALTGLPVGELAHPGPH